MNWHEFLDDDLRDLAALYVLKSLGADAARRYRLHLPGCEVCRAEVDSLAHTAAQLTATVPEVAPPPELWNRVLDRIRDPGVPKPGPKATAAGVPDAVRPNQVWKEWSTTGDVDAAGLQYVAGSGPGAAFESTGIEGIEVRRLGVDRAKDQVTMLVRMAAGTAYPAHRHGGAEECFVLQGDLHVGPLHMQGGDFQRAEAGSLHPTQFTDGGCLLLIVSSTTDELIEPDAR